MKSEKQRKHLERLVEMRKERGYWNSEETAKKIRKSNEDRRVSGWHSKETIKKISEANKGRKAHNKGVPMSEEQKKKISKARKGIMVGDKVGTWAGGSWIYWRKQALERDNYTCQCCGMKEPIIMEVCHIIPVEGQKQRRTSGYELNKLHNTITMCPNCHKMCDKGILDINYVAKNRLGNDM